MTHHADLSLGQNFFRRTDIGTKVRMYILIYIRGQTIIVKLMTIYSTGAWWVNTKIEKKGYNGERHRQTIMKKYIIFRQASFLHFLFNLSDFLLDAESNAKTSPVASCWLFITCCYLECETQNSDGKRKENIYFLMKNLEIPPTYKHKCDRDTL